MRKLIFIAGVFLMSAIASGQETDLSTDDMPAPPGAPMAPAALAETPPLPDVQWSVNWAGARPSKLDAWGEAWREAKTDEDRKKIESKTSEYLDGQFEQDMKRREKELTQIEARLVRLREQLNKRTANKRKIISLQLKQVTMGWDGLGWSDPHPAGSAQAWLGVFPKGEVGLFGSAPPPPQPAPPAPPAASPEPDQAR